MNGEIKEKRGKLIGIYESPRVSEVNIVNKDNSSQDPRHKSNSACGGNCWAFKKFFY